MILPNVNRFETLTTNRLLLKEITLQDATDLLQIRSNKSAMKYIDRPIASSLDDAEVLINTMAYNLKIGTGICWGICLKNNAKLVGTIGFWNINKENNTAEFGYMLEPTLQKIGIMTEAFEPIINYAFKKVKLKCLKAFVQHKNIASINLLLKNGFVKSEDEEESNLIYIKKIESI